MTGRKFVATSLKHVWAGAVIVATMLVVGGCALPGTEPPAPPATPTPAASPAVTRLPPATFTAVASKEVGPAATRVAAPAARAVATPSPGSSPEAARLAPAATPVIPGSLAARAVATARAEATELAELSATVQARATVEASGTGYAHRHSACTTGLDPMRQYASNDVAKWTADGAHILFTYNRAIWAVTPDGSRLWRLAQAPRQPVSMSDFLDYSPPWTATFDVTPDGKHVVYATCEYVPDLPRSALVGEAAALRFDYELAAVGLHGNAARRLTRHADFDNYPAWSPDGTRVAFVSNRDVSSLWKGRWVGLYIMAADGADVRRLAPGLEALAWQPPAWSPDGQSIAVAVESWDLKEERKEGHALYVVPADGAGFVRLSEAVSGGAWSPDGTRLAFAKPEGAEVALYTIAADGADARRVTTAPEWQPGYGGPDPRAAWIHTIAWSPDGTKLLYWCGDYQFCVVTRDGEPVRRIRLDGGRAAWPPDWERIAVTSLPEPRVYNGIVLYSAAPDGSDRQTLAWRGVGLVAAQAKDEDVATSRSACTAGFVVPAPATNPGLVRDCETLLAARAALFGGRLVNWGSGTPLARWEGVTVAGAPPRVTGLDLRDRYLGFSLRETRGGMSIGSPGHGGTIPPTLGALERLQHLDLSGNTLTGPIPPELENLTHLKELRLHNYGHLTGCIPAGLRPVPDNDLAELGLPDCEAGA